MFSKTISLTGIGTAKRLTRNAARFAFLFFMVKGLAWLAIPLLILDFAG